MSTSTATPHFVTQLLRPVRAKHEPNLNAMTVLCQEWLESIHGDKLRRFCNRPVFNQAPPETDEALHTLIQQVKEWAREAANEIVKSEHVLSETDGGLPNMFQSIAVNSAELAAEITHLLTLMVLTATGDQWTREAAAS